MFIPSILRFLRAKHSVCHSQTLCLGVSNTLFEDVKEPL